MKKSPLYVRVGLISAKDMDGGCEWDWWEAVNGKWWGPYRDYVSPGHMDGELSSDDHELNE